MGTGLRMVIPAFFYIFVLIVIKNITFVYDQMQQIVSKFLDKSSRQVILEKICHLPKKVLTKPRQFLLEWQTC
jgi:hypothetical protein